MWFSYTMMFSTNQTCRVEYMLNVEPHLSTIDVCQIIKVCVQEYLSQMFDIGINYVTLICIEIMAK